jgi:hypothetical protein
MDSTKPKWNTRVFRRFFSIFAVIGMVRDGVKTIYGSRVK